MAANINNIDVILDTEDLDVPACPHGPALLFAKYEKVEGQDGEQKKFFACSAFRDRKQCQFFQYADEKVSEDKFEQRKLINQSFSPKYTHEEFWDRFQKVKDKSLPDSSRTFCETCELLLLPDEQSEHLEHKLKTNLSCDSLCLPSHIFQPLDDNKTYAQYLFADSSVSFTLKTLKQLNITHVLCVGTPRIHETLLGEQLSGNSKIESLLLDLDKRYMQVFPPRQFCHFNMFNFHFFGSENCQQVYKEFVTPQSGKSVAIVIDPPFGGMVEALAATVTKMMTDCLSQTDDKEGESQTPVPVLWFFPYFIERRITEALPSMLMLDYKVDYDNHSLYSGQKKTKKGSPVRIFTNVSPQQIPLPADEGYRWCELCKRYSAQENQHCDKCGNCPSKDGTSYVHCGSCNTCVKPGWVHCDTCARCLRPDHRCGVVSNTGCHICGEEGHKRKDCPKKNTISRKRPKNGTGPAAQGMSRKKRKRRFMQKNY